jgi:hypothetical protein
MENQKLYQAILDRFTVRQYEQRIFDSEMYDLLNSLIENVKPLLPDNKVTFLQIHEINPVDLLVAQGPYGTFVNSPHVLLPYTTSQQFPLLEIGFQAQQVVLRLFEHGIGSCYLGTAGRENAVIRHFKLPVNSAMGASLVIGYPKNTELRSVANYFRKPGRQTKRMMMEELFFVDEFDRVGQVPEQLKPIMEAARRAPSAVNAQPWRFVLNDGWLHLFVLPKVYPFVLTQRHRNTYALHDAGLVMANISLAYEAIGEGRDWVLYDFGVDSFPHFPKAVLPVGKIQVN